MDWPLAIERNRSPLLRIVAEMIALVGALTAEVLPRKVYYSVLAVLRPAESAARRLIVVAARGITAPPPAAARPLPSHVRRGGGKPRAPQFKLFDTRKRFFETRRPRVKPGHGPRITFFPADDDPRIPLFRPPVPEAITIELCPVRPRSETMPAQSLCRRIAALQAALADIPKQAQRLARWRARRAKMASPKFTDPCRPGKPPGHRRKPTRPIDAILAECHWLAWEAGRVKPNTS